MPDDRQLKWEDQVMRMQYAVALSLMTGVAIGAVAIDRLHAQGKAPVSLLTEIEITNVDAYVKEYAPLAQASIKTSGGRLLAAGQNITPIEGTPPKSRVAIQQWDSVDQIKHWRDSA